MDTMKTLIDRLEKAARPDRQLDRLIEEALPGVLRHPYRPHYTASIDAALTLVPEGWESHQLAFPHGKALTFGFEIFPPADHPAWAMGSLIERGNTGPLVICIAALKARNSISGRP